jgi:hypothetical protein
MLSRYYGPYGMFIIIILYSITNLGQGGLFRSQLSCRLVASKVVVQVVVFLLDDNSKVVLGACCLPFYEHVGTTCVCMYKVFLLRVWHGILLKFRSFCGQEGCSLLFALNISFLPFEAYFWHGKFMKMYIVITISMVMILRDSALWDNI